MRLFWAWPASNSLKPSQNADALTCVINYNRVSIELSSNLLNWVGRRRKARRGIISNDICTTFWTFSYREAWNKLSPQFPRQKLLSFHFIKLNKCSLHASKPSVNNSSPSPPQHCHQTLMDNQLQTIKVRFDFPFSLLSCLSTDIRIHYFPVRPQNERHNRT